MTSRRASPASIFNFGFDNAIADGPGRRSNLGVFAWKHQQFQESPDGSFVIGASETNVFNAHLYNMVSLSGQGGVGQYDVEEALDADVIADKVHAVPDGGSSDWDWTLP